VYALNQLSSIDAPRAETENILVDNFPSICFFWSPGLCQSRIRGGQGATQQF
jgi:hypothetical protein